MLGGLARVGVGGRQCLLSGLLQDVALLRENQILAPRPAQLPTRSSVRRASTSPASASTSRDQLRNDCFRRPGSRASCGIGRPLDRSNRTASARSSFEYGGAVASTDVVSARPVGTAVGSPRTGELQGALPREPRWSCSRAAEVALRDWVQSGASGSGAVAGLLSSWSRDGGTRSSGGTHSDGRAGVPAGALRWVERVTGADEVLAISPLRGGWTSAMHAIELRIGGERSLVSEDDAGALAHPRA